MSDQMFNGLIVGWIVGSILAPITFIGYLFVKAWWEDRRQ